jgi:L-fuculose-phosphate aldolase
MSEKYVGTKFSCRMFKGGYELDLKKANELIKWCKLFDKEGFCPSYGSGNCGNMSFRHESGFVITPTACFFRNLTYKDLVFIESVDFQRRIVSCTGGREPSSETFLHAKVYQRRKDINSVFHAHSDRILNVADAFRIPTTEKEQPYGSLELAQEVEKILSKGNLLVMRNHGFISLGKTMQDAWNNILNISKQLQ